KSVRMTCRLKQGRRRKYIRVWIVGLLLVGAPLVSWGQIRVPITKVAITNIGPQNVSEALVRANIKVKEGDVYNRASIDDDVRNLYNTGYFYNIRDRKSTRLNSSHVAIS